MERLELRVPPPVVTLVSALLMWGLRGAVPSLVWLVPGRAWLAGVLVGTGMMLGLWAVWSFRRQRTTINPHLPQQTVALVTEGVYRYTRNPMYLGMLCFLLAWALYVGYLNRFQIGPEERVLEERFGTRFTSYCATVRRWL